MSGRRQQRSALSQQIRESAARSASEAIIQKQRASQAARDAASNADFNRTLNELQSRSNYQPSKPINVKYPRY
jgi:hypothetical protein